MRIHIIGSMVVLATFFSCGQQQEKTSAADTVAQVTTDTASPKPADTTPDPDPSDTVPASAYLAPSVSPDIERLVRLTLTDMYKQDIEKDLIDSFSRRFIFFQHDLNGDNKQEIFVGFTGPYFCGSGGCNILLLDHQGNKISSFTVADVPVVIDTERTKGYSNLFIQSGGKWHVLKFDGRKYPSNVSVQPVLKMVPGDGLPRALDYLVAPYPWFRF